MNYAFHPAQLQISIVVPVYNEEESLPVLHSEIVRVMTSMGVTWEVIYVDDCSTDRSMAVLHGLRAEDGHVRIVRFRRNYGQTAGMAAGFEVSRGELVVTMDADLQNDPADIPRMVAEIRKGHDIVAGWRKDRRDGFFLRRVPSIVANRMIAFFTGVSIHDTGCTLKVFRRELVKKLPLYAEQHRFLPVMSAGSGARVTELIVNHRPRAFGRSKYGLGRATRVLMDLLTVKMLSQFTQRPLHYFGLLALIFLGGGMFFGLVGLVGIEWKEELVIDPHAPKFGGWENIILSILMLIAMLVVYFALLGLLAELAVNASGIHRRGILNRLLNELH